MPKTPTFCIVPTKTYPFILPWHQILYYLLIEGVPCYQWCQNWFHLVVSYKLVVTKILLQRWKHHNRSTTNLPITLKIR